MGILNLFVIALISGLGLLTAGLIWKKLSSHIGKIIDTIINLPSNMADEFSSRISKGEIPISGDVPIGKNLPDTEDVVITETISSNEASEDVGANNPVVNSFASGSSFGELNSPLP